MKIPFYFDQTIAKADISGTGKTELINKGKTVISEKAPSEFIPSKQIKEAHKYQY